MWSFPLQTTTTSRPNELKSHSGLTRSKKSNNKEFATYCTFTLFLFTLQANRHIPRREPNLQARQTVHALTQCSHPLPGPSGSTCPLSKWEMAKLLWAIGSLTLRNKAEFKLGSPWTMAQIPPVSREKGFDYFLFRSEKNYSWSSHNKCWVRLINPSKPTSHQWRIQTYLVHKSQGTNMLRFPSSLAAILNPWGFSFTTP